MPNSIYFRKEHELETAVVVSDNLYIPGNNLEYVKD